MEAELPLPAYEQVIKASHSFNLLDARGAISVTERQRYILRVRTLARAIAQSYVAARAKLGFPMAEPALRDEVLAQLKAQVEDTVALSFHGSHFTTTTSHHVNHFASKLFRYTDGEFFNRFALYTVYFLEDYLWLTYLQFITFSSHCLDKD